METEKGRRKVRLEESEMKEEKGKEREGWER